MGRFSLLDPRRLAADVARILGDSREYCTVYRREPGESAESEVGQMWARISNIGRQTTGREQFLVSGTVTGDLWVLHAPPNAISLQHDDEIRTDGTRWRIISVRPEESGQVCVLSTIQ